MAQTISGTSYFRPTQDVSVGHSISSGNSAWAMIDEDTADDDSTYLQQSISSEDEASVTTKVKMTTDNPIPYGAVISSVKCYIRGGPNPTTSSSKAACYISASYVYTNDTSANSTYSSGNIREQSNSYETFETSISSQVAPDAINAEITTRGKTGKTGSYSVRVTQVYVVVQWEYTPTIFFKRNGLWQDPEVYQKQNGVWVRVSGKNITIDKNKFSRINL